MTISRESLRRIREVKSCDECQRISAKFKESRFRGLALSCAGETETYMGCDECLRIVMGWIKDDLF